MKSVRVINLTRDLTLAESAMLADTALLRMRGLLGRPCPEPGGGLVLAPCNEIHTFFMGYTIDVCFARKDGEVLKLLHAIQPWRMTLPCPGAYWTVELPPGGLGPTEIGDRLSLREVPDD